MSESCKTATSPLADEAALPQVFLANTLRKRPENLTLSFSFPRGEIGVSCDLYKFLGITHKSGLGLVKLGRAWYVYRDESKHAFRVATVDHTKFGLASATVCNRAFTEHVRKEWEHSPGDLVKMPVVSYATSAAELRLDPEKYRNPLYRLILDQKKVKA